MATSIPSCGPCDIQHITKPSIVWCTECDEGLCQQCQKYHTASKASRSHNTLPITEYQELPSDVRQLSPNCQQHNEKYTIYCRKHECPCCGSCVVEDHTNCRDLARLTNIIDKAKTSESLNEIEQLLSEMAENIQRIRQNRENNMKTLSEKKRHIEKEIKKTRAKINNHLDNIQDAIMKTLNTAEHKETEKISLSLALLDGKGAEISEYQKKVIKIKQHATDLQIFFFIKQFENEVSCKNAFLQSLVDTDSLKESELSYHAHNAIQNFVTDISKFGDVIIEKKPCNVILSRKKDKQAQMMVRHVTNRSVENINLNLHNTVNTTGEYIKGCCVLSDGRMAFTYYGYKILKVFNIDGSKDFEVKTPILAFDVAYISDDNTLVVTPGRSQQRCITIIDVQRKQIKKTMAVDSDYYGIAVKDKKIICSADKGIQFINPYKNSTNAIVREQIPVMCYVAHFDDKIYHTNHKANSVQCYDLQGTVQWMYKNESVLNGPHGISVDNDGNVYVAGTNSNNVVVLSADGQQHKEILTVSDGLSEPYSLDYDRRTNQLLVANGFDKAMMFTLI